MRRPNRPSLQQEQRHRLNALTWMHSALNRLPDGVRWVNVEPVVEAIAASDYLWTWHSYASVRYLQSQTGLSIGKVHRAIGDLEGIGVLQRDRGSWLRLTRPRKSDLVGWVPDSGRLPSLDPIWMPNIALGWRARRAYRALPAPSVAEVIRRTGMGRVSVEQQLQALADVGFAKRDGRRWRAVPMHVPHGYEDIDRRVRAFREEVRMDMRREAIKEWQRTAPGDELANYYDRSPANTKSRRSRVAA